MPETPVRTPPSLPLAPERMDWNLLRTFMFVVQERGVGRAAQALHLSQPAVSQALKRLEDAVGGLLLHRRNGEFRLTGLGDEIYAIARDMYGTMARIENAATQDRAEIAGTLRLLVMSKVQSPAYDDFLAQFHRRYPKIEFHVDVLPSAAILDALAKRVPALGICLCRKPVDALERRLFLRHHYAVVCGRHHPLFSKPRVSLEDLMDQNFVCFASDQIGDTLSPLTIFRDQQGFTGRIVGTSPNIEEIRRMVVAGIGLSFLPEHLIRQDVMGGDLRRLPPAESVAEIDVFLTWHKQRKLTAVEVAYLSAFDRFLNRTPLDSRAG
ncbi:CysJI operon transcriptional activator [Achromobacter spanius]|jgi:DNA-binding transcriptional LysR family regulator|uniref:LysR family transcriptional regulator n=1 Tax=Achromobacter TaxID=222 RepID=UPI000C2C33C6|nr:MULTISPECIES: LysR family transcriptional regulator [Achromobacter]SPT38105.1 CysJI operon transcriptional activator [Achromobacter denitrificans]AUA57689.1 LysR family transcriptional regulator [Achromobacter spanius]MCS3505504.1 DNA-binding transcriptional LysR family regulator [Achromobacter sp. JUb104]CAB3627287.1 HTH-type transcriptional regulator ArgP [Achromobacter spanius]VEE60289.1 CysJI operon transcriptional activator [Achromobacter spanius]